MQSPNHDLTALFEQLGLPADSASQESFVRKYGPLPEQIGLAEAPFWNVAQAALLREQIIADADWAAVVDQLNLLLRRPR